MSALAGKHALITGGNRGIGLAIAQALAREQVQVTICGRDQAALDQALSQLGAEAHAVVMDVAQAASVATGVAQARTRHGNIDILINNAGQVSSQPFQKIDDELWQRTLDVNLTGAFRCIQQTLPDMLTGGWGRIINIASTAGLIGYAYVAAYCASKHGVVGLTRALARELARKPITVNAICPGYTDTDIVRNAVATIQQKTGRDPRQALDAIIANNPQGRLITPEEVANCVLWLCRPGTESVTGQSLSLSGGEVT